MFGKFDCQCLYLYGRLWHHRTILMFHERMSYIKHSDNPHLMFHERSSCAALVVRKRKEKTELKKNGKDRRSNSEQLG
jgi:hypothetical protein